MKGKFPSITSRTAIRPGKEQEAENRVQQVYGEKYSPLLMFDSKKAVSRMLNEDIEQQAVRRMVRQAQKEHPIFKSKKDDKGQVDSFPSNGQRKKGASCRRIETATGGFLYGTAVHKGGAIG